METEPRDRHTRHTIELEVKANMLPDHDADTREAYPVVLKPELLAEVGEPQNGK